MGQSRAKDPYKEGQNIQNVEDYENVISKKVRQHEEKGKIVAELEDMMASLRYAHEVKNIKVDHVYNLKDPYFKGEMPDDRFE